MPTITPVNYSQGTPAVAPVPPQQQPAPQVEAAPPPKEADPLSPKFAALAKKEKMLRERERQWQVKEQQAKEQAERYQRLEALESKLKDSPYQTLQEMGIPYDRIANEALNGAPQIDPEIKALKDELKLLREEQNKTRSSFDEQNKIAYDQAVKQISQDVKALVDKDASFEMIKSNNQHDAVTKLIEETYKSDGVLLSVEEAASQVEKYLYEEALKYARTEKVKQAMLSEIAPKTEALPQKQQQSKQPQITTLTNRQNSSKASSERDRRERAILAFKGLLNQ
jgi:hypothetical protein